MHASFAKITSHSAEDRELKIRYLDESIITSKEWHPPGLRVGLLANSRHIALRFPIDGSSDTSIAIPTDNEGPAVNPGEAIIYSINNQPVKIESDEAIILASNGNIELTANNGEVVIDATKDISLSADSVEINGKIDINGTSSTLNIHNATQSLGGIMNDLMNALIGLGTVGSPTAQALNPATTTALQAIQTRITALLSS